VHVENELVHLGKHIVRLMDHQVGAFGDDLEVVVGNQGCNLYDHVTARFEPGHFKVHPHQHTVSLPASTVATPPCRSDR
jgi:hypothetical protein